MNTFPVRLSKAAEYFDSHKEEQKHFTKEKPDKNRLIIFTRKPKAISGVKIVGDSICTTYNMSIVYYDEHSSNFLDKVIYKWMYANKEMI